MAVKLSQTLRTPAQMIYLLGRCLQKERSTFSVFDRGGLSSIKRLRTDFPDMINPHETRSMSLGLAIHFRISLRRECTRRIGTRSCDTTTKYLQRHIDFSNQRVQEPVSAYERQGGSIGRNRLIH
jgi:hypothetical protein